MENTKSREEMLEQQSQNTKAIAQMSLQIQRDKNFLDNLAQLLAVAQADGVSVEMFMKVSYIKPVEWLGQQQEELSKLIERAGELNQVLSGQQT